MSGGAWSNDQPRDLVLPPGGNPNLPHRVIGPDVPAVLTAFSPDYTWLFVDLWYYDATSFYFEALATNSFFGGLAEWIAGTYDPTNGVQLDIFIDGPGGAPRAIHYGSDRYSTANRLLVDYRTTDVVIGNTSTLLASQPSNDLPETWHALGLLAGWVNYGGTEVTAQYRMVAAPNACVQLIGLIRAGTTADGTVIATLPAGYTPAHHVPGWGASSAIGARSVRVDIQQNGNITILGVPAGGDLALNGIYPLDA